MANNIHSSSASTVEQDPSAKKPGGWRAIKYILGNFHNFFFCVHDLICEWIWLITYYWRERDIREIGFDEFDKQYNSVSAKQLQPGRCSFG